MMSKKGTLVFMLGSIVGTAIGAVVGMMLAPRPGAETRAMAADVVNDAWDNAVDTYERSSTSVAEKVGNIRPNVSVTSDELRAKVDLARERMDQLRSSLSDAVVNTSAQVQEVATDVADAVTEAVAATTDETEAAEVQVEAIEEDILIDDEA